MTTLEIMMNAYEALTPEKKAYAEKALPTFDKWYDYNLNHWTNPAKDSKVAMIRTIDAFTAWFEAIAKNTYGLN